MSTATAVSRAPFITPLLLVLGLAALFYRPETQSYISGSLYTNIKLQSPMSWGAWTLLVITAALIYLVCTAYKGAFSELGLEVRVAEGAGELFQQIQKGACMGDAYLCHNHSVFIQGSFSRPSMPDLSGTPLSSGRFSLHRVFRQVLPQLCSCQRTRRRRLLFTQN
ncbi:MAG: hypothetical protein MZV63_31470 [Marinilabiliales bacterium]|nr:hypothetical protein [Marinilabiliales bacterium]